MSADRRRPVVDGRPIGSDNGREASRHRPERRKSRSRYRLASGQTNTRSLPNGVLAVWTDPGPVLALQREHPDVVLGDELPTA